MKNMKKMIKMNRIHDSTGHGVHNIIIYNIVSHNFQFLFRFQVCWNL